MIKLCANAQELADERQLPVFVVLGHQTKNQVDPDEEGVFVSGMTRRLFTVKGVTFGVVICHEGWRYLETVRWVAARGARIVFHPHFGGGLNGNRQPAYWGDPSAPDRYGQDETAVS